MKPSLDLYRQLDPPYERFDGSMLGPEFPAELDLVSRLWFRCGYRWLAWPMPFEFFSYGHKMRFKNRAQWALSVTQDASDTFNAASRVRCVRNFRLQILIGAITVDG